MPETCYKSTLIIPITFYNNTLQEEFLSRFGMNNFERTIFGYLCFDHIETEYFNDAMDVDFGYIVADILSLYLVTTLIYTKRSTTYEHANELINTPTGGIHGLRHGA